MNLIYYTSFGADFCTLTNISIQSLIKNGKFNGDIIVICDNIFYNNNKFNVKTILVKEVELNPIFYRLLFADLINYKKYNQIMYLDSDIEVIGDISKMMVCDRNILVASEYNFQIGAFEFGHKTTSFAFTLEQYNKYEDEFVLNFGTYCIDSILFNDLIFFWKTKLLEMNSPNVFGADQSIFNIILFENKIPFKRYENGIVEFHNVNKFNIKDNTVLLHYYGNSKKELIKKYEQIRSYDKN